MNQQNWFEGIGASTMLVLFLMLIVPPGVWYLKIPLIALAIWMLDKHKENREVKHE